MTDAQLQVVYFIVSVTALLAVVTWWENKYGGKK